MGYQDEYISMNRGKFGKLCKMTNIIKRESEKQKGRDSY